MRILYTSDLHGAEAHYEQLWAVAPAYDCVILGGDLLPNHHGDVIRGQRDFLRQILARAARTRDEHGTRFYAILGNDDWGCNQDLLEASDAVIAIAGRVVPLTDDWQLFGYGYVDPTPFGMKDWERWDRQVGERGDFSVRGYRSRNGRSYPFALSEQQETIAGDLASLAEQVDDFSRTICVMHAPPHSTPLDRVFSGAHVGSRAIRQFIEDHQPALTLHGHIHESPDRSGEWRTRIGRTVSVNPGQSRAWWHYVRIQLPPITLEHSVYRFRGKSLP